MSHMYGMCQRAELVNVTYRTSSDPNHAALRGRTQSEERWYVISLKNFAAQYDIWKVKVPDHIHLISAVGMSPTNQWIHSSLEPCNFGHTAVILLVILTRTLFFMQRCLIVSH